MVYGDELEFEKDLISALTENGWESSILKYKTEEDLIKNWADILFENNRGKDNLNNCPLTDGEMAQILEQINYLSTPVRLNKFINGRTISIKRDNPDDKDHFGKEVSLKIYDRNEIKAGQSRYQIAEQPIFNTGKMLNNRRGDLMLLINGMPVVHIEMKKSGIPISQACNQIGKYIHEKVFSGLFSLVQIFVAMTPEETIYFANPGPNGKPNENFFFHWADSNNEPINDWKEIVSKFLFIPLMHQMVGFYTVADATDDALKVMRSYQYWGASKISDSVLMNSEKENIYGGYVWHTTGSGKTMTSFKAAQLIADSGKVQKVIFLADRIELGTQTFLEYEGFANDFEEVQSTEDTRELLSKLKSDDKSNTLIVTSIQKMSNISTDKGSSSKDLEVINEKAIVFIVDECHRSTFGEMLGDIKRAFPDAKYFGFTGTPIFDENQKKLNTTKTVFGKQLHKYVITDGIRDHNVLGFDPYKVLIYEDRDLREKVALDMSKSNTVEEALADPERRKVFCTYMDPNKVPMTEYIDKNGKHVKGIEDLIPDKQYSTKEYRNAVVDDIIKGRTILGRGGMFHALFATSSIKEAVEYYKIFKSRNSGLKVTALFDSNIDNVGGAAVKEDAIIEILNDYNARYGQSFTIPTFDLFKKDISLRMAHKRPYISVGKNPDQQIDILIVVDQMLTGYDSKWINTLYLDKILRYENIIQAFSRTNRVLGPEKQFGIIRYYRKPHTMEKYIADAVALYSGDKPNDLFVQKIPENMTSMNTSFTKIKDIFTNAGIDNFEKLPPSNPEKAMFAKQFRVLNRHLEAAMIQAFDWAKPESRFYFEANVNVILLFDKKTYNTLLQRYKELPREGNGPNSDIPYDIDPHITEIKTDTIDVDYMNSRFKKFVNSLEARGISEQRREELLSELHRSFSFLSQEDQRFANVILRDFENGSIEFDPNMELSDYITKYRLDARNKILYGFATDIGLDAKLLDKFMRAPVTEEDINEYRRLDKLVDSIDLAKAKAFLEKLEGQPVPNPRVKMRAYNAIKDFILTNGESLKEILREKSDIFDWFELDTIDNN